MLAEGDMEVEFECTATNVAEEESEDDEESTDSNNEESETPTDGSETLPEPQARGISIEPAFEIRDKIKYKVEADKKGIEVKVEYEKEFEEMQPAEGEEEISGESETEFEIVFESIIEYAKNTSSGTVEGEAYDWELDEVVQSLDLQGWAEFGAVTNDTTNTISYFSATTADQVASFNFTISRANQGEKLTANTMKIDLHIIDFPWMRNDTYLALTSSVKSKSKVDMKYDDEATAQIARDQVMAADDVQIPFPSMPGDSDSVSAFGQYKWETLAEILPNATSPSEPTIDVQGSPETDLVLSARQGAAPEETASITIQVVATSPPGNETAKEIAYSFVGDGAQGASHIYWDPEAGIGYQEDEEYTIGGGTGGGNDMYNPTMSGAVTSSLLVSSIFGSVTLALSLLDF